jgi:replication factor A2
VTIKQILDADVPFQDAEFKIDGTEVAQVTFVGMVRNVSPQTTNVTFRLDDGTGVIEVKHWIDADKQADDGGDSIANRFPLDQYVRVWGRLKSFNNKRHVGAHIIKPVTDFNEVNYHLLEATYVHLCMTKGTPTGVNGNAGGDDGGSMFVDGGDGYNNNNNNGGGMDDKVRHCSAKARKFYQWLARAEGGNEGIHLNVIAHNTGMTYSDAAAAAEELIGPGVIYTTVDDETYAILDY